jgi:CCR4-NOT transcription complex subunit 7/8
MNDKSEYSTKPSIREVYSSTFTKELQIIMTLLHNYPFIAIDTSYPGFIVAPKFYSYVGSKNNANILKLIQLSISLSDKNGNFPPHPNNVIWQFNFKFSLQTDQYNAESIDYLREGGINFDNLYKDGIEHEQFRDVLNKSTLLCNDDLVWICYNGLNDFTHFVQLITNEILPQRKDDFIPLLLNFFPNIIDVKRLLADKNLSINSLHEITMNTNCYMGIERIGEKGQAASDCYLAHASFIFLIQKKYLSLSALLSRPVNHISDTIKNLGM